MFLIDDLDHDLHSYSQYIEPAQAVYCPASPIEVPALQAESSANPPRKLYFTSDGYGYYMGTLTIHYLKSLYFDNLFEFYRS